MIELTLIVAGTGLAFVAGLVDKQKRKSWVENHVRIPDPSGE